MGNFEVMYMEGNLYCERRKEDSGRGHGLK